MTNKSRNKRKSGKIEPELCSIPDFSDTVDSDAENIAAQMEFAARRTKEISTQMVTSKDKDISKLWDERHCFIGKLAEKIKEMKSIETYVP